MKNIPKHIIISRTDSIGDVVLTLPMAGLLKKLFPLCKITFLGTSYTKPILKCCEHIDNIILWDEIQRLDFGLQVTYFKTLEADTIIHVFPEADVAKVCKEAKISLRIGTTNRTYHWKTCNKLLRLSRKNSVYHEAQLNLLLLKPFGISTIFSKEEITTLYGLGRVPDLATEFADFISKDKFNIILHPRTKGSAREWGVDNFNKLITLLPTEKYKIFVSGTAEEGFGIKKELISKHPHITNLTGKFTLTDFISFINAADGIIAASTGPLHIAAALGKTAIGLYAPMRPIHPSRWQPIGKKASYLVLEKKCNNCKQKDYCECIASIKPESVCEKLDSL